MMLEMSMLPEMGMRVTPALLHLMQMLPLSGMELNHLVQQELSDNPALEEIEIPEASSDSEYEQWLTSVGLARPASDEPFSTLQDEEATDPLLFVAAPRTLIESLLEDLRLNLDTQDFQVAVVLVGSLDEQGFLMEELEDIAAMLTISQERVEAVLRRVQELGPPGIATRNVQECMLLQLDMLEAAGITCCCAREIIRDYMEELAAHRYKQIALDLSIDPVDVEAVRAFLQLHIWPYPMQSAASSHTAYRHPRYAQPDVAILEQCGKFTVEVLNSPCRILRLNPLYRDLARRSTILDEEARQHVQDYITRTRTFLTNLRQRELTLQRISEAIVERQEEFLRHGVRHLAPLTRSEIAAVVGMHESTVSRTIANKFVLLPQGQHMPFSEFFVAARGVQDVIRELIANETEPLSDAELARLLKERGYRVARRTVAKYREQMNILPSTLR